MPVHIADYDPAWPLKYEHEAATIAAALGSLLVRIEHIGSTSVPGLAAKPILDVMPGVRDWNDLDRAVEPLEGIGYEYITRWENTLPERRFFRKRQPVWSPEFNVHLYPVGVDSWVRHLLLRDYLRAHPDTARAYERLKRDLAPRFADVNDYAAAKTAFIRDVETRAMAEGSASSHGR